MAAGWLLGGWPTQWCSMHAVHCVACSRCGATRIPVGRFYFSVVERCTTSLISGASSGWTGHHSDVSSYCNGVAYVLMHHSACMGCMESRVPL